MVLTKEVLLLLLLLLSLQRSVYARWSLPTSLI